jgi:hypothetical protein
MALLQGGVKLIICGRRQLLYKPLYYGLWLDRLHQEAIHSICSVSHCATGQA